MARELNGLTIIREWTSRFSAKTAKDYLRDFTLFYDYIETPLGQVTTEVIEQFLAQDCPSEIVRKRRSQAIRGFYQFAVDNKYLDHNPALGTKSITLSETKPTVIDEKQVLQLLHHAKTDRECLIISLAYFAALSSADLSSLIWLNVKSQTVQITTGKRKRIVHIPSHLWQRLMNYRAQVYYNDNDPVFMSRIQEGRLSARQINRIINIISEEAGLSGIPVNARMLRASHAAHALARGAEIDEVSESLHVSAKTMVRYLPKSRQRKPKVRTGDLLPH